MMPRHVIPHPAFCAGPLQNKPFQASRACRLCAWPRSAARASQRVSSLRAWPHALLQGSPHLSDRRQRLPPSRRKKNRFLGDFHLPIRRPPLVAGPQPLMKKRSAPRRHGLRSYHRSPLGPSPQRHRADATKKLRVAAESPLVDESEENPSAPCQHSPGGRLCLRCSLDRQRHRKQKR